MSEPCTKLKAATFGHILISFPNPNFFKYLSIQFMTVELDFRYRVYVI